MGALTGSDATVDPKFRIFFDLRSERFVSAGRRDRIPEHWLPMPIALRNQDVLRWQRDRPALTDDEIRRCDAVVTAIRDYEIPMYVVEGDDEQALRDIFDRLNNFGKRLKRSEVFEALHTVSGQMEPSGLRALSVRVQGFGFGELTNEVLMQSVLAVRGGKTDRDFRGEFPSDDDRHQAFLLTERSLGHVVDFLREQAGVPHIRLLPYSLFVPVLARFTVLFGPPRNRELVARDLGVKRVHDFVLLAHLGADLPGAVRVVLEDGTNDLPELPHDDTCAHDHPLRFSLAGVQPKFSMRHEGKGLVLPVSGQGGDWIVKLPDRRFAHVPENEHAMLSWASASGIEVPEHHLVSGADLHGLPDGLIAHDEHALAVRRFDRPTGGRVHQEDFAQVRETSVDTKYDNTSYSGLGKIIQVLCPADATEYVRRLVAIVAMGNLDAHLKNWTLRYPDGRTPRLSPAYDLVAVAAYPEFRDDRLAFGLGGGHVARLITMAHFDRLATALGISPERVRATVRETTARLAETWPFVRDTCPVPSFIAEAVDARVRTLPLMRGR